MKRLQKWFVVSLVLLLPATSGAAVFAHKDIFGSPEQVMVLPNYLKHRLTGLDIVQVTTEGDIGTAAFQKVSYYRFDASRITEDRRVIRVVGITPEGMLEIESALYSRDWVVDPQKAAQFDAYVRQVADAQGDVEALKKIFQFFSRPPYNEEAGPERIKPERKLRWISGLQKFADIEFRLERHEKYGSLFSAALIGGAP